MKKLILFVLLTAPIFAVSQIDLKDKTDYSLKKLNDSTYVTQTQKFNVEFNGNVLQYKHNSKYISFTPVSINYDTQKFKDLKLDKGVKLKAENDSSIVKYNNVFDVNTSITNTVNESGWSKVIQIDTLTNIPIDVQYIEFIFKIETNYDLFVSGIKWDKKTTTKVNTPIKLDSLSTLETVKMWNNDTTIACEYELREKSGEIFFVKMIKVSDVKLMKFPIYTDAVISYGSYYSLGDRTNPSMSKISETRAMICTKSGTSIYLRMVDISGTSISSYGSEVSFTSSSTYGGKVCMLTSTKGVVAYARSNILCAREIAISGSTITIGSEFTIESFSSYDSPQTYEPNISRLSDDAFVTMLAWQYYDTDFLEDVHRATVRTTTLISGTFTNKSAYLVDNTIPSTYSDVVALTDQKLVGFYSNQEYSGYISAIEFNVNNTTWVISLSSTKFNAISSDGSVFRAIKETNTRSILGFRSGNGYSYVRYYENGGTSGNYGNTSESTGSSDSYPIYLGGNNLIHGNIWTGSTSPARARHGIISGNSVTWDSFYTYGTGSSSSPYRNAVLALSSTTFLVDLYTGSDYRLFVGSIPSSGKKINGVTYTKWNGATITKWNGQ